MLMNLLSLQLLESYAFLYCYMHTLILLFHVLYANLRPVDRRRKRAIFILINCAEGISLYRKKTYWPCDFGESYVSVFSDFLNERKSHDFALSTINRDTPTTFRNTFSFPRYNSHV